MCPSPRPDSCGTATPNDRHERGQRQGDLVADPAGGVLVGGRSATSEEKSIRSPEAIIARGPGRDLRRVIPLSRTAIASALICSSRHDPAGVRVDHPADLLVGELVAVPLAGDDVDGIEGFGHRAIMAGAAAAAEPPRRAGPERCWREGSASLDGLPQEARSAGRALSAWSRTWPAPRRREPSGSPPGSGHPVVQGREEGRAAGPPPHPCRRTAVGRTRAWGATAPVGPGSGRPSGG